MTRTHRSQPLRMTADYVIETAEALAAEVAGALRSRGALVSAERANLARKCDTIAEALRLLREAISRAAPGGDALVRVSVDRESSEPGAQA